MQLEFAFSVVLLMLKVLLLSEIVVPTVVHDALPMLVERLAGSDACTETPVSCVEAFGLESVNVKFEAEPAMIEVGEKSTAMVGALV